MSFPFSVGQVPVYYNHFNTGRPKNSETDERYVSHYLDIPNEPLLPFGFGLSYTTFSYSNARLSSEIMNSEQAITLSVSITNTGDVAGEEVVQLYIRDIVGKIVRPVKELKAFKKIMLMPNETKEVTFIIKEEQLRYFHEDLQFKSDPGSFIAYVGPNSKEVTGLTFKLVK